MNKTLSSREKVLMLVLAILLVGACWFRFFYQPVSEQTLEYHTMRDGELDKITATAGQVNSLRRMKESLNEYKSSGNVEPIPRYDNGKPLMVALDAIRNRAVEFEFQFEEPVLDEYIYSRTVHVSFTTKTYRQARTIIDDLSEETYVNQISDVQITMDAGEKKNLVNVGLTITFFEMAG